ncbi:MAG TPA: F0F1 ATP synthase subunit B [Verrucomicrobiae bacterium]|nr:F0F1 ATP synthase subunit B [Verrucomicrobiae bacterium]
MDLYQILVAATEAVQNAAEQLPHAAETIQTAATDAAHSEESGGIIGTLGINWKLFLAQLVNFGIVLFVFWKWIVKPLGKTLSDRQEKIEAGLKNAETTERERKEFETWKAQEMKKTRNEAEEIIKSATDTAGKMKQEILGEAQKQSEKMMEQTKLSIESEKTKMLKEVKEEVASMVVIATEKIIRHKLDPKKDHDLINQSLKNLK